MRKLTFKEEWYFIRQDIVSYAISTLLYVGLCLIRNFTIHTALYSIFDCFVFYLPFWFIRINFKDTYHSDSWKHCKMWTRIMLCLGVFILWVLPIEYSLFNGLFVAFGCCIVLYLVAIEVAHKKLLIKENKQLQQDLDTAITKIKELQNIDLYKMPEEELRQFGASKGLSLIQIEILLMRVLERLKISEICKYRHYGRTTIKYHIAEIKRKLNIEAI